MFNRRTLLCATVATVLTAGPAVAAQASHPQKPTHLKRTAITIKAAHATVAPKHKTTLTATLKSGKTRVAGEELWLAKRDASTHKFGTPVDIGATDSKGQIAVPVVPGNHKGKKEQYVVLFQGDTAYHASHSRVITITVVAPSS